MSWTASSLATSSSLFKPTASWEKTLSVRPSCLGAHLALLRDAGKLGVLLVCLEFVQSLCLDGGSFCLLGQTLLFVTVQVISLLRPLKHIRPVWVCLLKHEGESANSSVVSVWGNLHSLSPIALNSSINHLARSKSLTHCTCSIMLVSANICVSIASLRNRSLKGRCTVKASTQNFPSHWYSEWVLNQKHQETSTAVLWGAFELEPSYH